MTKNLTLLILSLLFFQVAKAQKTSDKLLYYLNYAGREVVGSDADYCMYIMPEDTLSKLSLIKEFYPDDSLKLEGKSSTRDYRDLRFEGFCTTYYQDGHRESTAYYKNGILDGNITEYFPLGKIYNKIHPLNGKIKFVECRDTSGNILAENGNGKWVIYYDKFKNIALEGTIKDSVKNGEWNGLYKGKVVCKSIYNNGNFISCTYYDQTGSTHVYHTEEVEPSYKNGPADFNDYLARKVRYPDADRKAGILGRVTLAFIVERDGSLTDVKVLRAPDESLGNAVAHEIELSPLWNPGLQNGMPVRVQYTISFEFKSDNAQY